MSWRCFQVLPKYGGTDRTGSDDILDRGINGRHVGSESQSILAPDCLMTFSHFSVSDLAKVQNSPGLRTIGVVPRSESCAFIFSEVSPALISRCSLPTTSDGVPRGTPTPYQMMAS